MWINNIANNPVDKFVINFEKITMKREIILDTETTGLSPEDGHRLVEIAALELVNYVPTGRTYHTYINPGRDVPEGAVKVHGLTEQFLKDFSCFDQVYPEFLDFIAADALVIHNAPFDMGFLNHALHLEGRPPLENPVVDTLKMARNMFPGAPASLDALCRRYKVDLSGREKHGALIDCELLAAVYLEMRGGRQQGLSLGHQEGVLVYGDTQDLAHTNLATHYADRPVRAPRDFPVLDEELKAHQIFCSAKINKKS